VNTIDICHIEKNRLLVYGTSSSGGGGIEVHEFGDIAGIQLISVKILATELTE
jgi:hypothetical protein